MGQLDKLKASMSAKSADTPRFTCIPGLKNVPIGIPHIYVDGSYDTSCRLAGWAWVAHIDGELAAKANGKVDDAPFGSRNITGEIYAAAMALEWADKMQLPEVVVVHDYIGLGMWGTTWKAKAPIAIWYKSRLAKVKARVHFRHVKGHSGNVWNEMADREAAMGKQSKKIGRII